MEVTVTMYDRIVSCRLTIDVERDIEWLHEVMFGADVAVVETFIGGTGVLDDEAPLSRPLVVIDAQTSIIDKRIETNR